MNVQAWPLVSVGLPTYNRPEGLERAIQYLLRQHYSNIEIVISDNASTLPQVKEILKRYASQDARIRYVIQDHNIQIEPNFNFVFHQAKGTYFMWIADDDEFPDDFIVQCVTYLESHSDVALCSGITQYTRQQTMVLEELPMNLHQESSWVRMMNYFRQVYKNGVFYGVYRNNMAFENPIQHHAGADWNHIARVALLGKIHTLESVKVIRSDDGGSSSRQKIAARWKLGSFASLFLETYMAYQVAKHLWNEPILQQKYNLLTRVVIQSIVFVYLNGKFFGNAVRKRLKK